MNKKLMLVSLLVLASSVAYARVGETDFGENYKTQFNKGVGGNGQTITNLSDVRYAGVAEFNKVQNEFKDVQAQLDQHGQAIQDINGVLTDIQLEDKDQNTAIEDTNKKLDTAIGDINNALTENQLHDIDQDTAIKDTNDKIDDLAQNTQENLNSMSQIQQGIENKVDKVQGQVNEHTEKLDKVESDNKVQNQQIAGVQSQADHNSGLIAQNKNEIGKLNTKVEDHEDRLNGIEKDFAQYDGRLSGLEKKVDNLDDKMNKGMSLMAAMNAVDFQNVQSGEMAIGAGIGHYGNAQSVAVGVAYAPTEDVSLNAKYSITAGDVDSFAVGAGASYKFKVGR